MKRFLMSVALVMIPLALAAQEAVLVDYDIALVNLERPVVRQESGVKATYSQAYLVRLRGVFPARHALAMRLFIGPWAVEEFGGLEGGIYFYIYERSTLDALEGQPMTYRLGSGPQHPLGQAFQSAPFEPFVPLGELEGLDR